MNKTIETFARDKLKEGLAKCTDGQQMKFKQMYSFKNRQKAIRSVVDDMPADKLDWALSQVENTLAKTGEKT